MERWPFGDLLGPHGESLADPYLPEAPIELDAADRAAMALRERSEPTPLLETAHEFTRRLGLGSAMHRYSDAERTSAQIRGQLESVADGWIFGWAWDPTGSDRRLTIELLEGDQLIAEVVADRFREDLKKDGVGDGAHGFALPIPHALEQAQGGLLRARVKGTHRELVNSPFRYSNPHAITHHSNFKLDPRNFRRIFTSSGKFLFDDLRVDPTDNCNANCVYCPIWRSTARLEPAEFEAFLENRVERIERLQFGCGQEPTLHPELAQFFKIVAARKETIPYLQMVTNGMLLHKHDLSVFRASGLNRLLVSMDTSDEKTTRALRPGTSVPHIARNIEKFVETCPETLVTFSIVVSSPTVDHVPELIRFGERLGVGQFVLREVHDFSDGHPRKPEIPENIRRIRLAPGRFASMKDDLLATFPSTSFEFIDQESFENPTMNRGHRAERRNVTGFEPAELQ